MTAVYLDSCMVIDLVEGDASQQALLVQRLLGKWVFTSELVRLESRIKAIRDNRQDFLHTYDEFFSQAQFIQLDRAVFEKATALRVQHRLKTPDALHLAAALHSACAEFWTNDLRLVNAAGGQIEVIDWMKLLAA